MTKAEIRKTYLARRLALTDGEYAQINRSIADAFFSTIDLSSVRVLHTFLPIEKNKEADTWLIIDRLKREFPHVRISIPRINPDNASMDHFYFEGLHQLVNNTWGIPEPKQGIPTPLEKIDIVLVPLLAVDIKGNRVGYGRGFYDKFLAQLDGAKKIGLSCFEPLEKLPADKYDIPIDIIITPAGRVDCN
jgi:5-formyltetrahydrofolate cyclo-ligase